MKSSTQLKHRNLPVLLLQAREALMLRYRPQLRHKNLTDQQWRVLRILAQHGTVDTGKLAREAYILSPSLSGILTRMEESGLVKRTQDPLDKRRTFVETTSSGEQAISQLSGTIQEHYSVIEQQLGTERLAQLYDLLDALIALETQLAPS